MPPATLVAGPEGRIEDEPAPFGAVVTSSAISLVAGRDVVGAPLDGAHEVGASELAGSVVDPVADAGEPNAAGGLDGLAERESGRVGGCHVQARGEQMKEVAVHPREVVPFRRDPSDAVSSQYGVAVDGLRGGAAVAQFAGAGAGVTDGAVPLMGVEVLGQTGHGQLVSIGGAVGEVHALRICCLQKHLDVSAEGGREDVADACLLKFMFSLGQLVRSSRQAGFARQGEFCDRRDLDTGKVTLDLLCDATVVFAVEQPQFLEPFGWVEKSCSFRPEDPVTCGPIGVGVGGEIQGRLGLDPAGWPVRPVEKEGERGRSGSNRTA